MKSYMEIGEYSTFDKKNYRCVPDSHSPMKRCILCELRGVGLCGFVRCQPDERCDNRAVIFLQVRRDRKIKINN